MPSQHRVYVLQEELQRLIRKSKCIYLPCLSYLYHSNNGNLNRSSCSAFVTGTMTVSSFPSHVNSSPSFTSLCYRRGGLRLGMRPLCAYFNSVVKPHTVLISPEGKFCNASMFAFNPGRIKVLQLPKEFFCQWFSHKARAV